MNGDIEKFNDEIASGGNVMEGYTKVTESWANKIDQLSENLTNLKLAFTAVALDGAKPTATYAVQLVESVLEDEFGTRIFKHTDVVDMTFACIGGVDAMHNSIDYVRVNPEKKAIVIAADYAKYGLESTGEYTQGAGAVAVLISNQPDLIEFDSIWGIGTESVFDFFKPRQTTSQKEVLNTLGTTKSEIEIFSDEPVFEGQY